MLFMLEILFYDVPPLKGGGLVGIKWEKGDSKVNKIGNIELDDAWFSDNK